MNEYMKWMIPKTPPLRARLPAHREPQPFRRPITIDAGSDFRVTGPGDNPEDVGTPEANGLGPTLRRDLSTYIADSASVTLPFTSSLHPRTDPQRLFARTPPLDSPRRAGALALPRDSKGEKAPWPQRPINSLQRGCASRIEPSTGPSKPTFGPTVEGALAPPRPPFFHFLVPVPVASVGGRSNPI